MPYHVTIFISVSFVQVIFTLYQFILFRSVEILYYSFYVLLLSGFIAAKYFFYAHPNPLVSTSDDVFIYGRSMVLLSFAMYYKFIRHYAAIKANIAKIEMYYRLAENILIAAAIMDAASQLAGISYNLVDKFIIPLHLLNFIFSIWVYFLFIKFRNVFTIITLAASFMLLTGMSAALICLLFFTTDPVKDINYMVFAEAGILAEYLVFSFGINYKSYYLQKENTRLAIEKREGVIKERERIIADLHDDIGGTLSSMSIYSDLAGSVMDTQPQETKKMIDKISGISKSLMERMGDIIWSMKSADEEKYTLEARLKNYTTELLSPKGIFCEFNIDIQLAASITNPETRKNILLITKEAINNIAKYSEATKASISLKQQDGKVSLTINDNGKGFSKEKIKHGNGLFNIRQRCRLLNGECEVASQPGNGVDIECRFPFHILSDNNS